MKKYIHFVRFPALVLSMLICIALVIVDSGFTNLSALIAFWTLSGFQFSFLYYKDEDLFTSLNIKTALFLLSIVLLISMVLWLKLSGQWDSIFNAAIVASLLTLAAVIFIYRNKILQLKEG